MISPVQNTVAVCVVLCVVACSRDRASQQEPKPAPTDNGLAQRFAGEVRKLDATLRVEVVDEREVRVYASGGSEKSSISYLDNLARICADDETVCDEGVQRFARTAVQMAHSTEASAPVDPTRVRAVLKDDAYIEHVNELMAEQMKDDAGPGAELAARRFVGDLWIVFVEDSPESMRMIRADDLEKMKLDDAGLEALAMKNMREAMPNVPFMKVEEIPDMWVVTAGDSYDAARLMLHEQWKPMLDIVDGSLIVAVPTRDFVPFTGTAFPEAVQLLRGYAAKASDEDAYGLSGKLYRWTVDGWVVYED